MLSAIGAWTEKLKHPHRLAFAVGLLAALFMTFVVWRHQSAVAQTDDPYGFGVLGRNIAEGRGFAQMEHPELPTTRRAPLYPAIIALVFLLGGPQTVLVRVVQCIAAALTVTLTYDIGERIFSKRVGLLAALMCALHPMVMRYVPDLQVECFLTMFMTLMVWSGVRFFAAPSPLWGASVGAAGALGALVKGVLIVCPPIFAAFWLVRQLRRREPLRLGSVAAIALAMCVVILPWTARNYRVTGGHFMLISSNAGGEFLRGYVFAQPKFYLLEQKPYEVGENEANQMEIDLFKAKGLVWARDEMETERELNAFAKEKLHNEPVALARKTFIGLFAFWYLLTTRMNSLLVGAMALGAWVLALTGWRYARSVGRPLWPLFQPILTLNLLYAVMLALGRYSAPTIPTLMVLAAGGVISIIDRAHVFERAT
ncbi:MAG: glycosyltransferase family 39 protein [Polyangiaceae bacterium]